MCDQNPPSLSRKNGKLILRLYCFTSICKLFGPMLVGLTNCDEVLPALLGEAESAWPEAPTLGGLQKGIPRC